jgi:gamma-carbonic anhydrase
MPLPASLITAPYDGTSPAFASDPVHAGIGAAVLGRATLGTGAWLGRRSVIRADGHYVKVGDDFHLGPRGTVHIAHDVYPTNIGNRVTACENSIIHACDVGDDCFVGRDAVILDGSRIGDGAALADGAVAYPRSQLEGGWLYEGQPARPVRRIEADELAAMHARARSVERSSVGRPEAPSETRVEAGGHFFLAASARVDGRVVAAADSSIWFGCDVEAGNYVVELGEKVNVQDNTLIRCLTRRVTIGARSTIGHNVLMTDNEVGADSLVGMGATLAEGTIVQDDVLLAAGARTTPGQVLESGWLYGGRPARQLSPLDNQKRALIRLTAPMYREYGHKFAREPGAARSI